MCLRSPSARRAARPARRALPWAALALLVAVAPAVAPAAQPVAPTTGAPAEIAFEEARGLYDGGLFGPAERAFAEFLEAHPRDARAPEALCLRAESALATDDDVLAAALFAEFEDRYPTHPFASRARLALGRYYVARGDDDKAEEALLAASASGPPASRAEASYLLGIVYARNGNAPAAAAAFERAAEADTPSAPPALYALGVLQGDAGDWARAADAFGALAERYPGSPEDQAAGLALAESLVRTDRLDEGADEAARRRAGLTGEDAARGALLEGESRLRRGDPDRADRALADVPPDSRYARRAALARGRIATARRDWAGAVALYQVARAGEADRAGDDAVAHEASYYEALALRQLGQLGEAEARLNATVARRPDGAYVEPALLELGYLQYSRRRYPEAVAAFRRLVDQNPTGPYAGEATRMLGEAYAAGGDARAAGEAFRRAEALGTATAETRAEVAFQESYALFAAGRHAEAVPALLAVAQSDPTGPRAGEALFWAGESAFLAQDYARSETILRDFLGRFPDHARADAARYVLAWTHFRRRDWANAADAFERFLSAYSRSSELVPYYADALLRLGDAYTALGRYAEARQVYARVPAATPERQGGDYALYQTAQAFGREGRTDDALAAYDRLLRDYPRSDLFAQALLAQGALYAARGDGDLAVGAYERVLSERPSSDAAPAALLGVGDVLLNRGDAPLAEAAYRRVFQRYPASPVAADAFTGLADALEAQGRGDEIDAAFREIDASTSGVEGRTRLRVARAQLALANGDDATAIVALEEALAGSPPPALEQEALLSLAGAYSSAGRSADAVRALRRLVGRYPDSALVPEASLRLAEALLATGDAEGARTTAAGLARQYPGDRLAPDAVAIEVRALQALGRADEADARLRELVARYPDSSAARAALRDRPDLAPADDGAADGGAPGDN